MAMEYFALGSAPAEEDCVQVGEINYELRMRQECLRFIGLIRKALGNEPDGAYLSIQLFKHDFGPYYEVVVWYDDENQAAVEYAFLCESHAPSRWSDGI